MKALFFEKCIGKRVTLFVALYSVLCLAAYTVYGLVYDYFDVAAFLCILLAVAAGLGYFFLASENRRMRKLLDFMTVIMVLLLSFGFAILVKNSVYVWADELNGITMFGSRGGLAPVLVLMTMFLLGLIAEIVACFFEDEKEKKGEIL